MLIHYTNALVNDLTHFSRCEKARYLKYIIITVQFQYHYDHFFMRFKLVEEEDRLLSQHEEVLEDESSLESPLLLELHSELDSPSSESSPELEVEESEDELELEDDDSVLFVFL